MPVRIEELILRTDPVSPAARASGVLQRFLSEPDCTALPLVYERTPLGVIHRASVFDKAISLGLERFAGLAAPQLAEEGCFIAEAGMPIGLVAKELSAQHDKARGQAVLVAERGVFVGLVEPTALFDALSHENTARARQGQSARKELVRLRERLEAEQSEAGITLARFAHEVRTPLTAILGLAEQLCTGPLAPATTRRAGEQIAAMSQELARLSQRAVESGALAAVPVKPDLSAFSLKGLVATLDVRWRPIAESKGLQLDTQLDRTAIDRIEADSDRLTQIASNLISNAVKYTPTGSICVSARLDETVKGLTLVFSVSDTGPGIPPDAAAQLFRPFSRLAGTQEVAGNGLGLHIARKLARQLSGTLDYSPGTEGGSVFTLSLPVTPAGPRLAVQSATAGQRRASLELGDVLLVEDHGPSRAVLSAALTTAGWRVEAVATIEQALRRSLHKPYQAILSDVHLGDGESTRLVRAIQGQPGPNRHTPCLAVTADTSPARTAQCRQAGFAGVIAKPVREGDLVTTLIDHLTARQSLTPRIRTTG